MYGSTTTMAVLPPAYHFSAAVSPLTSECSPLGNLERLCQGETNKLNNDAMAYWEAGH